MWVTVETFTSLISQYLPEPHAGLLSGISFGTKAALSKSLLAALIRTGTLHVVALSGMNISIVASLVSQMSLRLVSRRIASLLTILIIIGFVLFVGPTASVIRAAVMGSIALIGVIFGRSNWPIFSWFLAVLGMLAFNFSWFSDISFQLSALATLGIILFGSTKAGVAEVANKNFGPSSEVARRGGLPRSVKIEAGQNFVGSPPHLPASPLENTRRAAAFLENIYLFFEDDLRVTLAAQVFTIPIILFHFHRISLISPLPNILIGWAIGPLTILGWLVGFAGLLFEPLGQVVDWVAWVPLQYVLWVVTTTSVLPFAGLSF